MAAPKQSLLTLPISPHAPIYHLVPDPLLPDVATFLRLSTYAPPADFGDGPLVLREKDAIPPSMSRRSRQIRDGGAFSYTSPLPLEFPYDIRDAGDGSSKQVGKEVQTTASTIETTLARLEPSLQHPVVPAGAPASTVPTAFTSPLRESTVPTATLLSFSRRAAEAWLPQLDYGDAATVVLSGSGSAADAATREQLVSVLAGKTVLARPPQAEGTAVENAGFAPWSLCYGGHQFGQWASQLGDGRAISLLSTPTTPEVRAATGFATIELQLKGAGRTPYSRFADGLAVLRSSVREYLGSETMAALGQPTSRALALIGIPDVKVRRERIEGAAIVTRMSDYWIRIGNFEIQSYRQEWESLRLLSEFAGRHVFAFSDANGPPADGPVGNRSLALHVVKESARRNALMVAGWQAYGFMHGVMNTDNIALNGACIDYGPYAFQDVFDPMHICNHSDGEGRYTFRNQPTMTFFAITKLGGALAELIGCEAALEVPSSTGFVVASKGWSEVDQEVMAKWKAVGQEKVAAIKTEFVDVFTGEYTRLMRLRLGFATSQDGDFDLVSGLLDLMELHSLDYSSTIRLLSQFPAVASPLFPKILDQILPADLVPAGLQGSARVAWTAWFREYELRLNLLPERTAAAALESRLVRQNKVNPRFVLRQWILEETIAKLDKAEPDLKALDRVLEMASEPFEAYGEEVLGESKLVCEIGEPLEQQRLCGMGAASFLGFQCSCSS